MSLRVVVFNLLLPLTNQAHIEPRVKVLTLVQSSVVCGGCVCPHPSPLPPHLPASTSSWPSHAQYLPPFCPREPSAARSFTCILLCKLDTVARTVWHALQCLCTPRLCGWETTVSRIPRTKTLANSHAMLACLLLFRLSAGMHRVQMVAEQHHRGRVVMCRREPAQRA